MVFWLFSHTNHQNLNKIKTNYFFEIFIAEPIEKSDLHLFSYKTTPPSNISFWLEPPYLFDWVQHPGVRSQKLMNPSVDLSVQFAMKKIAFMID